MSLILPIMVYYAYISMKQTGTLRLKLLMCAYKDGILSLKSNGLIKW